MGGHMSKAHSNMSDDYLIKQRIRAERTEERRILQLAKKIYYEEFKALSVTHRSKLALIKKLLRANVSREEISKQLHHLHHKA